MKFKKQLFFYCILLSFFHLPAVSSDGDSTPEAPTGITKTSETTTSISSNIEDQFKKFAKTSGLTHCNEKTDKKEEGDDDEKDDDKKDDKKIQVKSRACSDPADDDFYYEKIDTVCSSSKAQAKECCEDPSRCSNLAMELAKGAVVASPQIIGLIKQYKSRTDVQKNPNLTAQEISDKICNADNKAMLFGFGSGVLGQFLPLLEKNCAKRIKQCKKKCNAVLTEFEHNFKGIINEVLPNHNIKNTIKLAKECMYDNENETFDSIHFDKGSGDKSFKVNEKNYIDLSSDSKILDPKCTKKLKEKKMLLTDNDQIIKFFSQVLFYSKTYRSMLLKKKQSFTFQEEEFINCYRIPDRIVTQDPRQATSFGHLTNPQIRICQDVVQGTLARGGTTPDELSQRRFETPVTATTPLGTVDLTTLQRSPLVSDKNNDDDDDPDGLPDPFPKEEKKKRPPLGTAKFGKKNPGGSSGGGGGGGAAGGGGSLGSNNSNTDYPSEDYGRSGQMNGNFASLDTGGYESGGPSDYGSDGMIYDREPSGDGEDNDGGDHDGFFEGSDDGGNDANNSIFEMASQKIKYFCSNQKCTK